MGDEIATTHRLELRCDHSAPRAARAALDDVEGIDGIRDDAKLIATELVTNAVMHGGRDEGVIGVEFSLDRARLLISVQDPGTAERSIKAPRLRVRNGTDGMGLLVVQQIATRWGSEWLDGHRVWAELTLNP